MLGAVSAEIGSRLNRRRNFFLENTLNSQHYQQTDGATIGGPTS